jgi:glycosyltransferase involved in cell wall biosynthesis
MAANSEFVRARIRRIYGRESKVIHPPVDVGRMPFTPQKDNYYIVASFLAPYKRTDLVLKAFRRMPKRRLLVVGEGQQSAALRSLKAPNITFTGYLDRRDYVDAVRRAKAMVFAGCEDFGIALAEAQAAGTPLIAFGRGGARDIVRPPGTSGPTGILFSRQTEEAIRDAVETFERNPAAITPLACHQNAQRFSAERFDREVLAAVAQTLSACAGRWAGVAENLREDTASVVT